MNYDSIKNSVKSAIKETLNNYSIGDRKIIVKNIKFDEKDIHKKTSWNHFQKVKNRNGTLSVPILADIEIKEKNKTISKAKNFNLGQLPIVNKNNTVLVKGVEYIVPVQIRRDPGIYTSQSTNGIWKTMINSAKGRNFKVEMDPFTNQQKIEIDGTRIPLVPLLLKLGIKKEDIIKTWGNDKNAKILFDINKELERTNNGKKAIKLLYEKLIYNAPPANEEQMKRAILNYFSTKSEFNPFVNKITLGTPHKTLSPKALLDISGRLVKAIKTNQGDDTENLIFKHVKTESDLIGEKIKIDFKKKLTASLNRNLKNFKKVKDIVRPGLFTSSLNNFFCNSEISEPSEQINPLHIINTITKTTIKGEGGITDENTVNLEMKSLHPSFLGFLDPLHTPDGNAGLVNHLTISTRKNKDGKLENLFYDKNGNLRYVSITKTWGANIATPDQYIIENNKKPKPKSKRIKVMNKGEIKYVSPEKVDYIIARTAQMFDPSTNLIPFINSNSGNRVSMGSKFKEQALSIVNAELPNVSTIDEKGREYLYYIGNKFLIRSPIKGKVTKVTPDYIEIKGKNKKEKVDIRNHLELNQESFFHDEPIVKVGDKVEKNQILTKNNWIDEKGNFLAGVNAKVAFMPYKGYSIEDGIVVSDTFAKKMTSQHLHVEEINTKEGGLNLERFKILFKNKYSPEAFSKLDSNGIVKKGVQVNKGDILIAYAKPIQFSEQDAAAFKLLKGFKNKYIDNSAVWNYDFPGYVIDTVKSGNLVKVKVKSFQPLEVTDKLGLGHGNKGVISAIIPESQMPKTKDGEPIDVIFNPHGTTSRINFGQIYEAALGKIAEKTKKRYLLKNFEKENNWEFIKNELQKHNISDTESLIDPDTNKELKFWNPKKKKFEYPFVGNLYIHKLVHQTRKKFDARGRGAYSIIDMPGKDPEASHYIGDLASKENPKSVDRLTTYAILAHGSKKVLADMWNNKGQNRLDVWEAIISGAPIPPPKVSTATLKGEALMRAAGINLKRKGRFINFSPLTDKDTLELSGGEIKKPNLFLRGKDLTPIKHGMFDPAITGGMRNINIYNHIDLGVKIPNPITIKAIKTLLDLSQSEFENILSGKLKKDGLTGIDYFEKKLSEINVQKTIDQLELEKRNAAPNKLNIINKKLKYLYALKDQKLTPKDYLISKIPVIPTAFRPIIPLPTGSIESSDLNQMYRDIGIAKFLANEKSFPKKIKDEAIYQLYNNVAGMQGVIDPVINKQNTTRKLKSVLTELGGSGSPKGGFIHSKLLSKTQDYIGSSVIGVNPGLGIDEIGIPFEMAEKMYEPFLLKELKTLGYKLTDYKDLKKKNPQLIQSILEKIVKERPVIINRNPSLHKGSVFGQNPVLIKGKSIQVNPMILKPLGADFDGDTIIVSVPISPSAVEEAKKMIPSLNVLNPKNDELFISLDQEYMAGIAIMTEEGRKLNLKFKNIEEAKQAYEKNQIRINDIVTINNEKISLGRLMIRNLLPKFLKYDGKSVIDKNKLNFYIKEMTKEGSISKYTDVLNELKNLGAKYAYEETYSFSLDDIKPEPELRKKILFKHLPFILKNNTVDVNKVKEVANKAQKELVKKLKNEYNRAFLPAIYGSRKISPDVMQQIKVTPFFVDTLKGPIKTPITKSYSEGLDSLDTFNMSYGARKAIVDKVNSVSEPGALSKELVASMSGEVITMHDCKTTDGVYVDLNDTFNLQNRVLAESVNGLKRNTILDQRHLLELKKGPKKKILVRSPLTCKAYKGVCALCYGLNEKQQLPKIGETIGIKAAQSIGETGTQSALSSHHLGGTVSAGSFRTGFEHTKFLLHMPQNVKNKATISLEDGVVSAIKDGLNNTKLVFIKNNPNPYICYNKLLVKVGDKVSKGDPLDEGPIKIQEMAEVAPMEKVQKYLVNELEKSYGNTKILRRNTETIVRAVTQYSRVVNPGNSPYLENELVPSHFVEWIKKGKPINVADAIGWKLKEKVSNYPRGTEITIDVANDLLKKKINEVVVDATGLEIKNNVTNISSIPLIQPDFYKKLSFEKIKQHLKEGPIAGEYSNVRGYYPEPALITGIDIGLESE